MNAGAAWQQIYLDHTPGYLISEYLSEILKAPSPDLKKLIIILGLFLVLLFPVTYLILKKTDRQKWIWWVVPLLSVFGSAMLLLTNAELKIRGPLTNSFTLIRCDADGASYNTTFSITLPGERAETFRLQSDAEDLFLYPEEWFSESFNEENAAFLRTHTVEKTEEGAILHLNPDQAFERTLLVASSYHAGEGSGLDLEIHRSFGAMYGTVSNRTGRDLKMVVILTNDRFVSIGAMKAGESVRFERTEDTYDYLFDPYEIRIPGQMQGSLEAYHMCEALRIALENEPFTNDADAVLTFALIQDSEEDFFPDPEILESNGTGILRVDHVSYEDYPDAVSLWASDHIVENDEEWDYDDPGDMLSVAASVRIAIPYTKAYAIRISQPAEDQEQQIFLFNHRTQAYEEVFTDTDILWDPADYLDAEGRIYMKSNVRSESYRLPDLLIYAVRTPGKGEKSDAVDPSLD